MNFFRKNFIIVAVILIGVAILAFISRYYIWDEEDGFSQEIQVAEVPFTPEGELTIYQGETPIKRLEIEFAENEPERELGLMYRSSMEENRGMLFVFPNEEPRYFYMKNTQIPLDIIYINADKQIVSIIENTTPYDETSLPSQKAAQYVLEVNAGMANKWGIKIGDTIQFQK